jgi:hypothetical protein
MRMRVLILGFAAFAFCLTAMAADDPSVGNCQTQSLGIEVQFRSATPDHRSENRASWRQRPEDHTETIDAQGKRSLSTYNANFDNKDAPVTGDPNADSASMKRDDANTTEIQTKKSGRITSFFKRIVSRDKKKMTVTKTQNNPQRSLIGSSAGNLNDC